MEHNELKPCCKCGCEAELISSEPNREQIENAIACRSNDIIGCMNDECYYFQKGCGQALYQDALSLIKELTEENKAWQKHLITVEEKADKAYYDLACEVEDLRAIAEQYRKQFEDCYEEKERLRAESKIVKCKECVYFKHSVSALFPHATAFICDCPYGLRKNVSENDFCCHGVKDQQYA